MRRGFIVLSLFIGLAAVEPGYAAVRGKAIHDCSNCPEMVALPAGEFLLGSPATEPERYANEGPQKQVRVNAFAIGRTEITHAQFAEFVADTGRNMTGGCYTPGDLADLLSDLDATASWRDPKFELTARHPVVCVSWYDARAYADWLSTKTGHRYRLPTEAEWEFAARAGTSSPYYWGETADSECRHMNGGDLTLGDSLPLWAQRTREAFEGGERHSVLIHCHDGSAFTAPVGSYLPNTFGLYDMAGNVWEWVEDCGDLPDYSATLPKGTECRRRRTRGGSWDDWSVDLRSAVRKRLEPAFRRSDTGFRLVRELDVAEQR